MNTRGKVEQGERCCACRGGHFPEHLDPTPVPPGPVKRDMAASRSPDACRAAGHSLHPPWSNCASKKLRQRDQRVPGGAARLSRSSTSAHPRTPAFSGWKIRPEDFPHYRKSLQYVTCNEVPHSAGSFRCDGILRESWGSSANSLAGGRALLPPPIPLPLASPGTAQRALPGPSCPHPLRNQGRA